MNVMDKYKKKNSKKTKRYNQTFITFGAYFILFQYMQGKKYANMLIYKYATEKIWDMDEKSDPFYLNWIINRMTGIQNKLDSYSILIVQRNNPSVKKTKEWYPSTKVFF